MTGIVFEKTYSRDITFLLASAGFYNFPDAVKDNGPVLSSPVLKQVRGGVVEFWINKEAFDYWNNEIKNRLISDSDLFEQTKNDYENISSDIRKLSNKTNPEPKDAQKMYDLFIKLNFSNHVMFISSMMEGWPNNISNWAKEQRERDDLWSIADKFIRDSLTPIFSLEEIKIMTPFQLNEYIETNNMPAFNEEVFVEDCAENIYVTDIEKLAKEKGFTLPNEITDTKEIKGQIGYKGKIIGKVKIVYSKEDLSKVKEGDIIVSPMTTPDFVPAMKIASAFVTDEGGMLCHAAIVSRELKKPCIIGTKIATQVLKDGMEVEVDADVGIVKIL